MAKAKESQFEDLHQAVTSELASRVREGPSCSTADIKAAIEWLKINNVTGVAADGSALKSLMTGLTEADQEYINRLVQ